MVWKHKGKTLWLKGRFEGKFNNGSKKANSCFVVIVNVWSHNHNMIWDPLVQFLHITPFQLKNWMVQTTFFGKWKFE